MYFISFFFLLTYFFIFFNFFLFCTYLYNITAADCKRDGSGFQPIDSRKLCRGDIVQIKAGQKIPADIRVITASDDMKVR